MKIRVSFSIEINPDVWATTYGVVASEVRNDVQGTYEAQAKEHAANIGALLEPSGSHE